MRNQSHNIALNVPVESIEYDMVGGVMGIDRHELEHRNWRSATVKSLERGADIAPIDVTIVPDDIEARSRKPKTPKKSSDKKSSSKVKSNA